MRWTAWVLTVVAATVAAWWLWPGAQAQGSVAGAPSAQASRTTTGGGEPVASARPPFRTAAQVASQQARQSELQLWRQRLERATATLDTYRTTTRYPFDSRPAAEQADQLRPNDPIVEEVTLQGARGPIGDGLRLRTSQDGVFVQGRETVRLSLSLVDARGAAQPLRIVRAAAREIPAAQTAATHSDLPLNFNDGGVDGDAVAADRVYGVALQPASTVFADLLGQIRVDAYLEVQGQQAHAYFDLLYSPRPPAVWQGGVREAVEAGSLSLLMTARVDEPGRYVVSGRVDDARGRPFAVLTFNDELAAGVQTVRLRVFGKLLRDEKPEFPLTLRDVEGFLLRPDAFPDRVLMPRRVGTVHTTARHALSSFADQEWRSEERDRYLAELNRDVADAQRQVERLGSAP